MCSQKWASPGTLSGSHKYPVGERVCVCVGGGGKVCTCVCGGEGVCVCGGGKVCTCVCGGEGMRVCVCVCVCSVKSCLHKNG